MRKRHVLRQHVLMKPGLPTIGKRRKPVPSPEVVERYLAAIPDEVRGLFLTRSIEVLRPSEARRLRVSNFNWKRGKGVISITRDITKTEAGVRKFEVDGELEDWLFKHVSPEERLKLDRPLFINPNIFKPAVLLSRRTIYARKGLPLNPEDGHWEPDAEDVMHVKACVAIGAVDAEGKPLFSPNIMGRHAAATHMMARTKEAKGVHDIEAVRAKLGHTDAATTRTYTDVETIDVSATRRVRRLVSRAEAEG